MEANKVLVSEIGDKGNWKDEMAGAEKEIKGRIFEENTWWEFVHWNVTFFVVILVSILEMFIPCWVFQLEAEMIHWRQKNYE